MDVSSDLEPLYRGLTEPQRIAVASDDSPLCVVAGAGSGKTTVLTRRVARRILDGSADAEHTLVVTFTRKAATELQNRIARLCPVGDVWAGTFHAAAYAQMRQHWSNRGLQASALVEDPARVIRQILRDTAKPNNADAGNRDRTRPRKVDEALVSAVVAEIHWAQVRLVAPDGYRAAARVALRVPPANPELIAATYERYLSEKKKRRVVDLDDLINHCADLLESDSEAARVQRWRFRHLFVDEFQDLNPAQWRLLKAWLGERPDLFVVGDPKQAIYGWNGADPELMEQLPSLVPGTSVLSLSENHRSSPQIVAVANAVFDTRSSERADSTLRLLGRPTLGDETAAICDAPDGPVPVIASFESEELEAEAVARWMRKMHRPGVAWSHLAVLARTNSRLETIAAALGRAGMPHRVTKSGASRRAESGWFRYVLRFLRAQPGVRPLRGTVAELVLQLDPGSTDGAGDDEPRLSALEHSRVRVDVESLLSLVDEHCSHESGATVESFLSWLWANDDTAGGGTGHARRSDVVEVTTFHRAKGLEWRSVAIVGLEDGHVPISYASTAPAYEEETRLFYVALTRASHELWCSWAQTRALGDQTLQCERSPFLDKVEYAASTSSEVPDSDVRRAHIVRMRELLSI